jgi:hypothetical protein
MSYRVCTYHDVHLSHARRWHQVHAHAMTAAQSDVAASEDDTGADDPDTDIEGSMSGGNWPSVRPFVQR